MQTRKNDALGNLTDGDAQSISSLLRGARGRVKHHRCMGVIFVGEYRGNALYAVKSSGSREVLHFM